MLDSGRKSAVLMAGFVLLMHCSQGLYMHNVLQELGYMARRGHKTGVIRTYKHTWLLKADEGDVVKVSIAIHFLSQRGGNRASVTEIGKLATTARMVAGLLSMIMLLACSPSTHHWLLQLWLACL